MERKRQRLLTALFLSLVLGLGSCSHAPDQQLVGDPIPAKTQRHTATAKQVLVETVSDFTLNYDQAVCRRAEAQDKAERMRQAVSEAYIELNRALQKSARRAEQQHRAQQSASPFEADTSEPDESEASADDDGILWMSMESGTEAPAPTGGQLLWFCSDLTAKKACVESAANATTRAFWRHFGEPADLDYREVPLAFDAITAEFDRGFGVLTSQPSVPEALETIAAGCRNGDSPLAEYLERKGGDRDGRARMAQRLKGNHATFCQALPQIYEMTAQNLRNQVQSRLIDGRCRVDSWSPLPY